MRIIKLLIIFCFVSHNSKLNAGIIDQPLFHLLQTSSADTDTTPSYWEKASFIDVGLGLGYSNFRDFATSPLVYSGMPILVSIGYVENDERKDSKIAFSYAFGNYDNDFNNHITESNVNTFTLSYYELFQIQQLSSQDFNFKIGGHINSTANLRQNEDLFNNSVGFEVISTLFLKAKGTLFFDLFNKFKNHSTSLSLDIGALNTSYRNGYAYTIHAPVLNSDDIFSDYEFNIFSGFRMMSSLDYTIPLENGNAYQFSYLWDSYFTGGDYDEFEMASHFLKVSILFSL
ncbi:MAG: hypothetical protein Kapaf2KO_12910 [Candidatus Kapaibacteriales bacterium]